MNGVTACQLFVKINRTVLKSETIGWVWVTEETDYADEFTVLQRTEFINVIKVSISNPRSAINKGALNWTFIWFSRWNFTI